MKGSPIKILHIVTSLEDGGLEKIVYLLVSNLKDQRFEHHVAILIKYSNSFLLEDFRKENVKLVEFDFDNRYYGIQSLFKNLSQLFRLARYIKKHTIQIIHSHDFFPAFFARISALVCSIFYFFSVNKIFITLHNSFFWLKTYHHFFNRLLSHFTTKIICVSKSVLEFSELHDRINKSKYSVIYNGVEIDKYTPSNELVKIYRNEFQIPPENFVIGNVGVLSIRKGQKYLIEAVRKLLTDGYKISLLIFGSERSHEKQIAEEINYLIEKYNLQINVNIIQPRKDLHLIYNIFDLYVMPSITEGLSLCAIEAMLMRRICLFSDINSFKEMITDGVNGYLFKSQDIEQLHLKMEFIINNSNKLKHIQEYARKFAMEKFNVENMCSAYEKLYLD
jgi:glycosyltransferase involved in cell wall biosynthesis